MKLEIKKNSPSITFIAGGRIDTESSPEFQKEVEKGITEDITEVIFDFKEVSYLASAGIRVVIIAIKKTAAVKGSLKIINCMNNVKNIFEMVGLSKYIEK